MVKFSNVMSKLLFLLSVPAILLAQSLASIDVNTADITGTISPYFFGQFIEHEHNTIQGGLWAEMLRDRKFEQGDLDGDGVSNGWVPEERVQDRYWQLQNGIGPGVRYFIDHADYYGGGASQAIELTGTGSPHGSVYQIGLQFAKGRRYVFHAYVKSSGRGTAFVSLDRIKGQVYGRQTLNHVPRSWQRFDAEFTALEDTSEGRLRIGFEGTGTFHVDSSSLMPADNLRGMRRDVVEALRPLRIPLMRYPGGCFADYYHWQNGLGDRDKRAEIFGPAWQEWDPNDFGIDEFMDLAHELGFSPHLTANYVTGTPAEAARWVEYMNGASLKPMGKARKTNGHEQPYGVKFWAVGNEAPSLCSERYTGGTELTTYASRYNEYRTAMEKIDPGIQLMASSVGNLKWIHNLLEAIPVHILAISIYTGEYSIHPNDVRICDLAHYYRRVVAEPLEVEHKIEQNIQAVGKRFPQKERFFAISEINSWWLAETVDPDYRLANALYFAGVFNVLLRRADQILTAEASTTINVQGLVEVNPVAVKLTPPYFAYVLYANHIGRSVLKCEATSPKTEFDSAVPALDAAATLSQDGKIVFLAVTNRAENQAIRASLRLHGHTGALSLTKVFELNGKDRDAANPFGRTDNVNIRERAVVQTEAPFEYVFPPHSVNILEFRR
jgi:alpha-N-arabinofuranosidase